MQILPDRKCLALGWQRFSPSINLQQSKTQHEDTPALRVLGCFYQSTRLLNFNLSQPQGLPAFDHLYALWLALYGTEGRMFMKENLERNGGADVAKAGDLVFDMAPELSPVELLNAYSIRTKYARLWSEFFDKWDIVICPNSGSLPLPVGTDLIGVEETEKMMRALSWQIVPPLTGVPSLAIPMGTIDGLPTGVQILSQRFREDLCFDAGNIIEQACDFMPLHAIN